MKAKLTSHLLPARTSLFALAVVCSALPSFSSAQISDFQKNIDSSNEALIALDVKASDCLTAMDSDENSQAACDDFIQAVDGELLANYLKQCRTPEALERRVRQSDRGRKSEFRHRE